MAYTAGNLHLRAGAPGDLFYTYDSGSDALATVLVAGYFNNEDDGLNLTADDVMWCQATDGNCFFRVLSIDSGSAVTLQFAGGNLPIQTQATGTSASVNELLVGYYDISSDLTTATRMELPTPYAGAEVLCMKADSGSKIVEFSAGAATTILFNADGDRETRLLGGQDYFHVVGTSATRWRILSHTVTSTNESGSYIAEALTWIAT